MTASPDERTLSVAEYLGGALVLAAIVAPLAWAAWRLRRTLLPGWTGAPARLVETVVTLSALIVLSELVGTFDAYNEAPMIVGALAVAGLAALAGGRIDARRPPGPSHAPPAPPSSDVAKTLAALACAGVAAAWMVPTLAALAGGMDRADTLWYHMPLSARFVQTGSLGEIFHFDPIFFAAYYPANSEAVHAVGILAFSRDILSPLLNLGFLAIGLLAAWCIGRPYGLAPQALIGGAIALGAQNLIEFQAGEALNDIAGTSFVLSAVAVLVNGRAAARAGASPTENSQHGRENVWSHGRRRLAGGDVPGLALAVAGLAAGLAAGTKLSFLAPVAALFVGAVVIAGRGGRVRTAAWFALPALLTGGYWYLRNLFAIGNPIPFTSWGPLGLPTPERGFELRERFSVAHYWNDTDVWSDWFFPGLNASFGELWPLVLAAMAGGALYALWRGGEPVLRMLGAVVLFTAIAYLFTPLTAAGEEGRPIAFEWNVRYLAPAAAVGLALLPCLPAFRASARARALTLAGLSALLLVTLTSLVQWQQGHVKGAVAGGVGVLAVAALLAWLWATNRLGPHASVRWVAGLAAVALAGSLAAGWWEQDHYLERRYQNLSPRLKLAAAVREGVDLRDARVAVAGVRGVFNQYPFYGTDLSNRVQWLGEKGEDGAFLRIPTCERWRQALAEGEYTHVVTTYDPFNPDRLTDTKEGLWTRRDPVARELLRDGPVSVFELEGTPTAAGCERLPQLSEPELNGDSVNLVPTANQP